MAERMVNVPSVASIARARITAPGSPTIFLSPTCRPDDPDSPDSTRSQPPSPAPSRKPQVAAMTVQVGAALGFLVIRRAGSIPGASALVLARQALHERYGDVAEDSYVEGRFSRASRASAYRRFLVGLEQALPHRRQQLASERFVVSGSRENHRADRRRSREESALAISPGSRPIAASTVVSSRSIATVNAFFVSLLPCPTSEQSAATGQPWPGCCR